MRILVPLALAMMVGGLVLAFTGSPLPGALLFLAGMVLEAACAAVSGARRMKRALEEWHEVLRGGPSKVRIVSIQPPPGVIFNHEATVVLELEGQGGAVKQVERQITVPRVQALTWRLGMRFHLPLPKRLDFKDELEVNLRREIAAAPEAPPPPA